MSLKLNGATSGYVEIDAPAVAGSTSITLPATSGGEFVVTDSSGKVGIGTTSVTGKLSIDGSGLDPIPSLNTASNYAVALYGGSTTGNGNGIAFCNDNGTAVGGAIIHIDQGSNNLGDLAFYTAATANSPTERARIDSSGRLLVGTTSASGSAFFQVQGRSGAATDYAAFALRRGSLPSGDGQALGAINFSDNSENLGAQIYATSDAGSWTSGSNHRSRLVFSTTADGASSPTERMRLASTGVSYVWNNNNSTAFIAASSVASSATVVVAVRRSASTITGGTDAYYIYANGSAGSASDVNLKKNIETTRDGYLEDLNRLRVVKYNWNNQEDTEPRELGLIAQEVEEVFPGLACDMKGENEDGEEITTKGIKYSVLPVMLLKALQEANAKIETLETQNASFEARLTALEGGQP